MSDYFRHARFVSRSLDWARQSGADARRRQPRPVARRHPVRRTRSAPRGSRTRGFDAFQAAIDHETAVADEALALIQQHVDRFAADDFFQPPVERDALLTVLEAAARPLRRGCRRCTTAACSAGCFRSFSGSYCRVVRDFYHKLPVDEHTLLTIRNLERLVTPSTPSRDRFCGAARRSVRAGAARAGPALSRRREMARPTITTIESVRMARRMFERIDLPPESRALVEFLIDSPSEDVDRGVPPRHRGSGNRQAVRRPDRHRRASEDAVPADAGRRRGREPGNADAVAGGAALAVVRRHATTSLTLGYGDELIERDQTGRDEAAGRPAGRRVRGRDPPLPRRAAAPLSPALRADAIYRHVQLSRDIKPDEIHASLEHKGDAWELTVVTLDKPFLFSNICGVLSSFGMDILRGHAMTNPNGLVLDTFQFTDEDRYLANEQRRPGAAPRGAAGCRVGAHRHRGPASGPRAQRAQPRQGSARSHR